jgi:hypothetical protein
MKLEELLSKLEQVEQQAPRLRSANIQTASRWSGMAIAKQPRRT